MFVISHKVPRSDVLLGVMRAENVRPDGRPPGFDERLRGLLEKRKGALDPGEEARRAAARDILRNGSYKPTGRGKPASEYLLRAASKADYSFPRINGPVDVCNLVSLEHVVPISLWDLDRAGTRRFVFRLGRPGEGYVFNEGGQRIDVEDLLVGCRVGEGDDPTGEPVVNPVRDSLGTKTTAETRSVAACVYAAATVFSPAELAAVCREFADLLSGCGDDVRTAFEVVEPQSTREI